MGIKVFDLFASLVATTSPLISDTAFLNSYNSRGNKLPKSSDVVVVGGGIHALIYAIHAKSLELQGNGKGSTTSMTILEKSPSPTYKIGESTLTVFGLWLKTVGIDSPMLSRLFGPKDGLAFFYFSPEDNPENYTQFVANGPPADFVPTLQIERKISELMLTLYAQRLGINVLHGKEVIIEKNAGKDEADGVSIQVRDSETMREESVEARLVIDATGRFHRFISKEARIERVEGFNTNAYWAYFECPGDESEIPLRHYESVNTNHICLPEGWAWVIRLPSWEGSSIPNLTAMINHLLDLNAAKAPADSYPSVRELVERFQVKFRWVVSIGFALRSDVIYPENISSYGSSEAEQKFNWIVSRYQKVSELMEKHKVIENLYGPGTTWFVRKNLAFRAPRVTGKNWLAIGDATGFTNPLYSPGINASMSTSIYAAEMTKKYLSTKDQTAKKNLFQKYEEFCKDRVPKNQRMNVFNYVCMRSPELGPLGPIWQYLCGTGNEKFQNAKKLNLGNVHQLLTTWDWGSNQEEFITFSKLVILILDGSPHAKLSQETIDEVKKLSAEHLKLAMASGKYKGRWAGLLRWYDDDLNFVADKVDRDVLARRCWTCGEWKMLRPDCRKCVYCGWEHTIEESTKVLY
ncbi:hypothetical protein SBOR_6439 [Sclerotinia borealis F-4128]|uniref:FAD/NAD(P)-binding domain-containing protein n=1 Tax=Sclerotinia borealis (strain F-4128) TaxID=1432307 RepID=W9CF26_SCLBF|nr:hypothetical protein SBOR_6439 [Sclerotinia borealis F-4128]